MGEDGGGNRGRSRRRRAGEVEEIGGGGGVGGGGGGGGGGGQDTSEGKKKASLNTHPLPPIDRWTKSSFNHFLMTHIQLHNFIMNDEIIPSRANSNKQQI